jgi:hypothetical protein
MENTINYSEICQLLSAHNNGQPYYAIAEHPYVGKDEVIVLDRQKLIVVRDAYRFCFRLFPLEKAFEFCREMALNKIKNHIYDYTIHMEEYLNVCRGVDGPVIKTETQFTYKDFYKP